jgi:hypothetical protein
MANLTRIARLVGLLAANEVQASVKFVVPASVGPLWPGFRHSGESRNRAPGPPLSRGSGVWMF